MQVQFRKFAWPILATLAILSLAVGAVAAHEGRPVGDYRFIVGWLEEPAYEGLKNAVSIQISKVQSDETMEADEDKGSSGHRGNGDEDSDEGQGHHENGDEDSDGKDGSDSMKGMDHGGAAMPVEGLEGSIQVEVTHVPSGVSRIQELLAVFGEPGHYVAVMIPTASGVYEFRVFGTIEGTAIDETFVSTGGGGGFDDIRSSASLQFPEQLPELREVVGAAQGARDIAQQAQDAAQATEKGGSNTLALVALILGIAGVAVAGIAFVAVAVLPALRRQ